MSEAPVVTESTAAPVAVVEAPAENAAPAKPVKAVKAKAPAKPKVKYIK